MTIDHCTVRQSEVGGMRPLIIAAVNSQNVRAFVAHKGLPDPLAILWRAWTELETSLMRVLTLTANWSAEAVHAHDRNEELEAYKSFVYRCAEFAEAVEMQTRRLTGGYKLPRSIDRLLSEQCNAMKHDNMRLTWVSACDREHRVNGFQFRHHVGKVDTVAERFHSKRPSYSFNMELRRHWAGLYLLGDHAGRAVIAVHGPSAPIYEQLSEIYMQMLEQPSFVFEKEANVPFAMLREYGDTLEVALDGSPKTPIQAMRTTVVTPDDGFSPAVDIPDT